MTSVHVGPTDDNWMNSIDCVVKIGGSALTNKREKETFNEALFDSTLKSVVELYNRFKAENGRPIRLVLIHGAGSFAHPHAKAGKVHLGFSDEESAPSVVYGLCDTRLGLHKLSHRILDQLVTEKVPVTLSSVFPGWKTNTVYVEGDKKSQVVEEHTCKTLLALVNMGIIPLLHGDCVMDTNQKTAVLSGDLILDTIARELRPKHVVYVSDVDGVFSEPPIVNGATNSNAKVITGIDVNPDGTFEMPSTHISCIDVSGGMAAKISAAAATAVRGVPVFIVKGGTSSMVEAGMGKTPVPGTTVRLRP